MSEQTLHDRALSALCRAGSNYAIPARTLLKNLERIPVGPGGLDAFAHAQVTAATGELRPLLQALDVALANAAAATVALQVALPKVVDGLPGDIREVAKAALAGAMETIVAQQKVLSTVPGGRRLVLPPN